MQARILVVDDDTDILTATKKRLTWMGHDVLTAESGEQALKTVIEHQPDLMLLDIELPGLSGLEVLQQFARQRSTNQALPLPEVIVLTAFGTIGRAVEAMRLGAFDFLTKPFELEHLSVLIDRAMEKVAHVRQIGLLKTEVERRYEYVIGQSHQMIQLLDIARRAAASPATVLLLGETGTGKEVVARAIHRWSPRASKPFAVINCAAFTETLLENELFGHEQGAYTGATKREAGKIEAAQDGTVFLDEIGDMPVGLQTRLLRLLQDQQFCRLGGTKPIRTNVRFVAATNKDLKSAIEQNLFREDLFYRLNVVSLTLPPLRNRVEDLPALVTHFVTQHGLGRGNRPFTLSQDALEIIRTYHWPGNVRELENVMMRAIALCPDDCIEPAHLGITVRENLPLDTDLSREGNLQYHETMELYSRKVIEEALHRSDWNQTRAAELLGLTRSYLTRLIRLKGVRTKPSDE